MADFKVAVGQGTGHPLDGMLSIPDVGKAPWPGVVLVHGSGPSDKDERIGANAPFLDIARGLSARGIAVLRYDKRTKIYGKQMKKEPGLTVFEETIEDAVLASGLLKRDPRIDPEKVFIIGHSMGGMLAPRIDAEGGDFAGLIIMAGSPRKLEEIIAEQGATAAASLKGLLKKIAQMQVAKLSSQLASVYALDDEAAKARKVVGNASAYYFKEMGEHPAPAYLSRLGKPILVLQGDKDFQVSMEKDFEGYEKLLAGRERATFRHYAQLNHLFMPSVYGQLSKYKKEYNIPSHVDEAVLCDIAEWILSN